MKKHAVLFLLFLNVVLTPLFSQTTLTRSCNSFRSGDRLVKQEVEYKDPGKSGEHIFWDFSTVEPVNDHYQVKYYSYDDSLMIGQERRTLYKYIMHGDSLMCSGFENKSTLIANRKPELMLVFPLSFGNRHEDYFHGNGDYCGGLFLTEFGKTSVVADACGEVLLPEGDTLRHVLRTHHTKYLLQKHRPYILMAEKDTVCNTDSIESHLTSDSLHTRIDTYRWYAEGYRYPVFETICQTDFFYGQPGQTAGVSFYYAPNEQYYSLDDDSENRIRRDSIQIASDASNSFYDSNAGSSSEKTKNFSHTQGNHNETSGDAKDVITYSLSRENGVDEIILNYSLSEDATVSIMLFDIQSRQLSGVMDVRETSGDYRKTISLRGLQPGEYTLRIVVNNTVFGEKIIK